MSRHKKSRRYGRDAPQRRSASAVALTTKEVWSVLCLDGYRPVMKCPEVQMCINVYAKLIASMTIRLMRNDALGDVREKNELSRRLDIHPARYLTRHDFMQVLVRTLMETGNQITLPVYGYDGLLERLVPLPPSQVQLEPVGLDDYQIVFRGQALRPDEVLHFRLNPDPEQPWRGRGFTADLREIVKSLRQSSATRQALKESPAPSIIVKVDGLTEEFQSPEGRRRLRAEFIDSSDNGEPWFIPSEAFSVEQVRPLTMADLAIKDDMELDKRAIAALMGVPPFLVGVGDYNREAYQQFLTVDVMALAREIEQTLTEGLLYSPDLYWSLNPRSLYNYSLTDLISVGKEMVDRAAMRRNELRDWLGMPPDADMEELYLLENYLPTNRLGDQKKLNPGTGEEGGDADGNPADPPDADV